MTDEKQRPYIRNITLFVLVAMVGYCLVEALLPVRPFWNDEWRLTYNVKMKSYAQLWGRLDLLQECPRMLLMALKLVTSACDYSYASFRLPALVVAIANLLLAFHLKKRLFERNSMHGYLFVLVIAGSETFVRYLVQFKHYEVDLFLSLTGMWQLLVLLGHIQGKRLRPATWLLLLVSFCAAPYFSYVYPIVVAPVYIVLLLAAIRQHREAGLPVSRWLSTAIPLVLCALNIVVFYLVDVRHMLGDSAMYQSYREMLGLKSGENPILANFWYFFALVGAGALFEVVYGILGIAAFIGTIYLITRRKPSEAPVYYTLLYGVLLVAVSLVLVFSGKLMGGVGRLVAFTIPSLALMMAVSIPALYQWPKGRLAGRIAFFLLMAGACGNIITNGINTYAYPEYNNRIATFRNTGKALEQARAQHLPFMYTDGVLGDPIAHDTVAGVVTTQTIDAAQIRGEGGVCAEVIVKVHPAYKLWDTVALYHAPGSTYKNRYVHQLPANYHAAVFCDGLHWEVIRW